MSGDQYRGDRCRCGHIRAAHDPDGHCHACHGFILPGSDNRLHSTPVTHPCDGYERDPTTPAGDPIGLIA